MEFFFPSHWHTQRWTIPPVDKSCVCCQQTLSLRGCDLQPHTHPTGSLRVPQCSVRWKAHVPTSPLNDRAADHFKQNFPSVGGGMLKSLSRYPGELFGTLNACVCVCKCNVFYCVYSLWVHVYARTDLCCQVPPHKCVCVCVPQYTCQLWSFFAQPCGTQQMCSALPRGSLLRSLPLSSHSHLARSSAHTPQCLYATALQIISWLHYLSPFLPLVISSLLPSISLYPSKHVTTWDFFKLNLSKLKAFSGLRWSKCCFKIGLLDLGGLKTWYICYFFCICFAPTANKDIHNLIQGSEAHTQSTLTMINGQ